MINVKDYYNSRINKYNRIIGRLIRREKLHALFRFTTFISGIFLFYFTFKWNAYAGFASLLLFIGLFVVLVLKDFRIKKKRKSSEVLRNINEKELDFLNFKFDMFEGGDEFIDRDHPFSSDLDIFGNDSLFQFVNRTTSARAKKELANWFKHPYDITNIKERQESIRELSKKPEWREHFRALGILAQQSKINPAALLEWLNERYFFLGNKPLQILSFIMPVVTILTFAFSGNFIPIGVPILCLFINFWIVFLTTRRVSEIHQKVSRSVELLHAYSKLFDLIENEKFKTELLSGFKKGIICREKHASKTIRSLSRILGRLDFRLNMVVAIPLNLVLLWDLHHIFILEKWKKKNNREVDNWFNILALFDAFSSLANLAFNKPMWVIPVEKAGDFNITTQNMGHPLIPDKKRIDNSFKMLGPGKIVIVTGSNMSGKTTFLRTIGVNLLLAMTGVPVPASSLEFTRVNLRTSMRIADSLTENTSSFYAELKRLKSILEAVKGKEQCLLLLDEILKGTNSADRHKGSDALIRQLIKHNAVGLLATHDLDLSNLEKEIPDHIENYNFDVQIEGDELYFDYKIHKGVCKSLNASILMKKMGIDV